MENNKQNTVLLTIIAVATLLVAVVGATFAYFTASNSNGSTSIITTTSGKMEIKFEDGSNKVDLSKTGFTPGDTVLITKSFTLTGTNTSIGQVNNGSTNGMDMPYTVDLEYQNGFTTGQLHYEFKRTDSNTAVTSSLDSLTGKTKTGTFTKTATGDNNNKITGAGTEYERLVTGSFPAVKNSAGTTIGFTFTMTFPDNNDNQDENKGAEFAGKIVVNRNESENKGTTA